jgi:tRNA(fMet)-specific endonuclease VapC
VLDTGVLVAAERGRIDLTQIALDDDICVTMITVAELMTGVAMARPEQRERMRRFVDGVLSIVPALPYNEDIVDAHATLLSWTLSHGRPWGQHDLMIAATALVTGRTLLTMDRKARFDQLPGLSVELLADAA